MVSFGWFANNAGRFVVVAVLAALARPVFAADLDDYRVMALSPIDERAVVQSPDNRMTVVEPGDSIEGTRATVKQVLTDRLVLEEKVTRESGMEDIETVWVYKAAGGESKVQRLRRQPPEGEDGVRVINKQVKPSDR
jgi:hypothetical protein